MPGIYIMFNLPSRIERIKLAAYTGSPAPPKNGGRQNAGQAAAWFRYGERSSPTQPPAARAQRQFARKGA
jgi:hypothetical protein